MEDNKKYQAFASAAEFAAAQKIHGPHIMRNDAMMTPTYFDGECVTFYVWDATYGVLEQLVRYDEFVDGRSSCRWEDGSIIGKEVEAETTVEYKAIDLGLPSGTKWADRNVGATSPEEAGKYFAWGDTEGCRAEDIKEGMFTNVWYINRPCHLIESDITPGSSHDAAHVNMGAGWQMPSKDDLQELRDHTRQRLATINGVDGTKFINKKDNSKYIFIPFAGCTNDGQLDDDGDWSGVWSTVINSGDPADAWHLYCDCDKELDVDSYGRFFGLSVRGVTKK